ncbi:hypothetical protein COCCADRAFT_98476, partial [Bipolaris zeicola 26-R-13]
YLSLILLQLRKSTTASETPSRATTKARAAAFTFLHMNHLRQHCFSRSKKKKKKNSMFLHLAGNANPLGDTQQKKKEK